MNWKKKMIDVFALSFSGIIGISIFFAIILQKNIYTSFLFFQPAIVSIFLVSFEWLSLYKNQLLFFIIIFIFFIFLSIVTIFSQKYVVFYRLQELNKEKNMKGIQ